MGGEENEQMVVGEDWVSFDVERKNMAERKMRFFGHIVRKNGMEKRLMQGKVGGKGRRGRPAKAWFQDLKEWTKLDIAAASQLATDRERWREIIKVTAAPPDEREREMREEIERREEKKESTANITVQIFTIFFF